MNRKINQRIKKLDITFSNGGYDRYGVSRERIGQFYALMGWLYRHYFRVDTHGLDNIPDSGRVMLIGNHSGAIPTDGAMVSAALFHEHNPPRFVHAMADYFFARTPFVSSFFREIGQLTGLPENAKSILNDGRVLMVFPEGARGTGKLYKDRYKLVRFGTGFMRLAMETNTPIIPFGFVGGEEAVPMIYKIERLAKLFWGLPYIPVPPQLLPIPFPVSCQLRFGSPMQFNGTGTESETIVRQNIMAVKTTVRSLLNKDLSKRSGLYPSCRAKIVHDETQNY